MGEEVWVGATQPTQKELDELSKRAYRRWLDESRATKLELRDPDLPAANTWHCPCGFRHTFNRTRGNGTPPSEGCRRCSAVICEHCLKAVSPSQIDGHRKTDRTYGDYCATGSGSMVRFIYEAPDGSLMKGSAPNI